MNFVRRAVIASPSGAPLFTRKYACAGCPPRGKGSNAVEVLPNHGKSKRYREFLRRMHRFDRHVKNTGLEEPVYQYTAQSRHEPAEMCCFQDDCNFMHSVYAVQIDDQKYEGEGNQNKNKEIGFNVLFAFHVFSLRHHILCGKMHPTLQKHVLLYSIRGRLPRQGRLRNNRQNLPTVFL